MTVYDVSDAHFSSDKDFLRHMKDSPEGNVYLLPSGQRYSTGAPVKESTWETIGWHVTPELTDPATVMDWCTRTELDGQLLPGPSTLAEVFDQPMKQVRKHHPAKTLTFQLGLAWGAIAGTALGMFTTMLMVSR